MIFYKPTPFKRRPIVKLLIGLLVLMLYPQTIYPQKCEKCDTLTAKSQWINMSGLTLLQAKDKAIESARVNAQSEADTRVTLGTFYGQEKGIISISTQTSTSSNAKWIIGIGNPNFDSKDNDKDGFQDEIQATITGVFEIISSNIEVDARIITEKESKKDQKTLDYGDKYMLYFHSAEKGYLIVVDKNQFDQKSDAYINLPMVEEIGKKPKGEPIVAGKEHIFYGDDDKLTYDVPDEKEKVESFTTVYFLFSNKEINFPYYKIGDHFLIVNPDDWKKKLIYYRKNQDVIKITEKKIYWKKK